MQETGVVVAVSRAAGHGFSKGAQPSITLIAGEGVEGDAHRGRTVQHLYQVRRDPTQPNLCQVHLFASEALEELAEAGFAVAPGELGENVLTRGLDLLGLPQHTCSKIDKFQPGLQARLWGPRMARGKRERRAGVMAVVLTAGKVCPGDRLAIELPGLPHVPLGPV